MTAPHLLAPSVAGDRVEITGADARHAIRVLRLRLGERVTVSDGRGSVVEGDAEPAGAALVVHVRARRTVPEPRPRVHVYPAVPKGGKLDLVVQKLTEIGVASIRPWLAARSVVRWDDDKRRGHGDRLRAIAWEAGKQSRAAWLPEVADPGGMPDPPRPAFVLHEGSAARLGDLLPREPPADVAVVTGPEGGLEDAEVEALEAAGGVVCGLGPRILRAETAALMGPALVMGRYHLLG